MEARFCPQCGTSIEPRYTFCPKCGIDLSRFRHPSTPGGGNMPLKPASEPEMPIRTASETKSAVQTTEVCFKDENLGTPIAKAQIPLGFFYDGGILPSGGNDLSQLPDWVRAESEDRRSVILFSESHFFWEEYLSPTLKQAARLAGLRQENFKDFIEPETYMRTYAESFTKTTLRPTGITALPGRFAQNRKAELMGMIETFLQRDGTAPNVQMEIINAVCDPLLMRFTGVKDGRNIVVLVGCEYKGIEYRNAITLGMLTGGALGLIGGLLSQQRKAATGKNAELAPFGHGKEYGKQSDAIRWGFNRIYLLVSDAVMEDAATEQFLRFVSSFIPDEDLLRKRDQMEYQIYLNGVQQANQFAAQARQNQMMAQQRTMETSRMIARNAEQISAGLMDSWNRKMASDSRISQNYSEAVRGVNTYRTADGRGVDVEVTADHVYQNGYGDMYGVSGNAPGQEFLTRLNWTEIGK